MTIKNDIITGILATLALTAAFVLGTSIWYSFGGSFFAPAIPLYLMMYTSPLFIVVGLGRVINSWRNK